MFDLNLPPGPGEGPQWEKLAAWLRERIMLSELDGIWVLRTLKVERREYGTAILSLVAGERRRIITTSYVAVVKGKQRGGFEASLAEVGSGPLETLHELLALVPIRREDEGDPVLISPSLWFPELSQEQQQSQAAGQTVQVVEETNVS